MEVSCAFFFAAAIFEEDDGSLIVEKGKERASHCRDEEWEPYQDEVVLDPGVVCFGFQSPLN